MTASEHGFDRFEDRDPLEVLAAEFTDQCRRGELVSIDEWAQRHPELEEGIRELFPTIAAIEQAKSATPRRSGSGAVRGDVHLERLGDFRIVRELGRGGMGIVYEAEQESLGRRVAIKVLPRQLLLDREHLARFQREARTAAGLHHTNIVPIFGAGECEGYHYLVMQHIRCVGLDAVIAELHQISGEATGEPETSNGDRPLPEDSGPLDPTSVARSLIDGPAYWRGIAGIVRQAAEALAYAHDQGTMHRDIKPANLLLDAGGAVWVADFGLAKAIDQEGVTRPGDVVGTLRYMAPEQFEGKAGPHSDIYSLGLTMYELVTLEPAFAASGRTGLIDAIMASRWTRPRVVNPDIPRDLETIILKCLARDPAHRYASAAALADDLRRFEEDRPILAARAGSAERLWRWARRNRALASALGTAVFLLLAVSVVSTAAYLVTSEAGRKAQTALAGEQAQRARAEETARLTLEALETIFDEFAPRREILVTGGASSGSDQGALSVTIQPTVSRATARLLEHMLVFYRRLAKQDEGGDPALGWKIADAHRRVGDIHQRLGAFEDAMAAYDSSLDAWTAIQEQSPEGTEADLEIARIHTEIGNTCMARDRRHEARDAFLASLSILEPLSIASADSPALAFELARTLFLLGRAYPPPVPPPPNSGPPRSLEGGPPPPRERRPARPPGPGELPSRPQGATPLPFLSSDADSGHLHRAADLLQELATAHPDVADYRHLLALCYRELSDPPDSAAQGGADGLARAIETLEHLTRDFPAVPRYRLDLSETYAWRTPRTHASGGADLSVLVERTQQAVRIGEELVAEHPNTPAYALSLAHAHHKLADVLRRMGAVATAEQSLLRAISLQDSLADEYAEVTPYRAAAALFRRSMASLLIEQGRWEEAQTLLESALADLKAVALEGPQPMYVGDLSGRCRRALAEVRRRLEQEHGPE